MSNPPAQPPNPNEPEPGSQPQAPATPQYGQPTPPAPQYGQNTPPAPQYGQNTPQYGQQAPAAPQFGQQAPQFGQNAPAAPQFGQQPYGQSPYAQYPSERPSAGSGTRPPQVDLAFWLIVAAAVLSFITALIFAFGSSEFVLQYVEEEAAKQGESLPPGAMEVTQGIVMAVAIIGGLVSLGLYALVAFPVRKGKNWARILGTVFAALSVLGLFGGAFTLGPLYGVAEIITTLLGIAAIVLLYLPANAPYFQNQQPFANPYGQPGNPYGR